ncbi:unnamed protein product [Vitrella brassicaformis CCMP3155]|uniref:PH domain-containing protein n=1 Tax=Vitrella brassicaformis (strain CCMP3155) TaxID=1169540 RepID=A0A0G4G8D7_VITBC|nr:unnamed protein product [Vitrella brassicaformis CCMP3155]|eukprot:CEM25059.1 unnamed protein product [Vitrella brassicaformis CCMP3155]
MQTEAEERGYRRRWRHESGARQPVPPGSPGPHCVGALRMIGRVVEGVVHEMVEERWHPLPQPAPPSSSNVLKSGWVYKKSRHLGQWRWRWLVVTSRALLFYREPYPLPPRTGLISTPIDTDKGTPETTDADDPLQPGEVEVEGQGDVIESPPVGGRGVRACRRRKPLKPTEWFWMEDVLDFRTVEDGIELTINRRVPERQPRCRQLASSPTLSWPSASPSPTPFDSPQGAIRPLPERRQLIFEDFNHDISFRRAIVMAKNKLEMKRKTQQMGSFMYHCDARRLQRPPPIITSKSHGHCVGVGVPHHPYPFSPPSISVASPSPLPPPLPPLPGAGMLFETREGRLQVLTTRSASNLTTAGLADTGVGHNTYTSFPRISASPFTRRRKTANAKLLSGGGGGETMELETPTDMPLHKLPSVASLPRLASLVNQQDTDGCPPSPPHSHSPSPSPSPSPAPSPLPCHVASACGRPDALSVHHIHDSALRSSKSSESTLSVDSDSTVASNAPWGSSSSNRRDLLSAPLLSKRSPDGTPRSLGSFGSPCGSSCGRIKGDDGSSSSLGNITGAGMGVVRREMSAGGYTRLRDDGGDSDGEEEVGSRSCSARRVRRVMAAAERPFVPFGGLDATE